MSDQSSSLNQAHPTDFGSVLQSGFGAAATIFTAQATAKSAQKVSSSLLNPATLGIIGGGILLTVIIIVIAVKK